MKSTTAPKRSRSITLPIAPPAMAPSATAASRARPGAAKHRARRRLPAPRRRARANSTPPRPLSSPKVTPRFQTIVEVEHRQQHDLADFRQIEHVQHPPLAGLVGRQHEHSASRPRPSDRCGSCRRRRSHHAAARHTRPDSTASAQRAQSPGWPGCWPTSGSTRQQRAHLSTERARDTETVSSGRSGMDPRGNTTRSRPRPILLRSAASLLSARPKLDSSPATRSQSCPRAAPLPKLR